MLILIGSFLLMLPVSNAQGISQPFIDALFTAASAVSTTGLIVVDTPVYYSLFGQIIIIILIQIGGLGYMVFFVLASMMLKRRITISGKKYLRESITRLTKIDLLHFARLTIYYTLVIESIGALLYFIIWIKDYPVLDSAYLSVFHSISAFCTAGFSLFSDSLCGYKNNLWINIISNILVIAGALGFFVLYDVSEYLKQVIKKEPARRLTVHTKTVLSITASLLIIGTILVFLFEPVSGTVDEQLLTSSFQVISASTTVGFNTVDIGTLCNASLFILIILMFIGASPGSTGGGIKTTSFAVFSKFSLSTLTERESTSFFKRSINLETYKKAAAQIFVGSVSVIFFTLLLTITEKQDFIKLLFESVSAFGTVGLSTGITFGLSFWGKIFIIALMFIGRIGPLVIGLSLLPKAGYTNYQYPEEEIIVS